MRLGQAFQADVVNSFVTSPNYRRGALFLIYDEWGGFFDHVKPPRVPDDRASTDLYQDFGQMGFRIPAVAISPWSRNNRADRGKFGIGFNEHWRVDHGRYGHESILSFLSYRFGLGFLNKRHETANNIGRGFNWLASELRASRAAGSAGDRHPALRDGRRRRAGLPAGARERPRRPGGRTPTGTT